MLHDAYVVMLQKERDGGLEPGSMHPREVRAYLVQTAINKALDVGKRAGRGRSVPLDDDALATPDLSRTLDDVAAATLDSARVREIVRELPARRQAIVKLRFFYDRSPAEVQRYLGISERAYRKDLEHAVRFIASRYELVREGRFCESRRSLLLAYVAGIAGPGKAREAREHLATCPGCAAWAVAVREAARETAAVLPMPPVVEKSGLTERAAQAFADLRENVTHLFGNASHHVNGAAASVDSGGVMMLSGARPGAVMALVAGCVAMGGSATYCAVQGVPEPLRLGFGESQSQRDKDAKKEKQERRVLAERKAAAQRRAQARATAAATTVTPAAVPARRSALASATTTTTTSKAKRKTSSSKTSAATKRAPAAVQEFGLEGSGEPINETSSGSASAASAGAGSSSSPGGRSSSSSSGRGRDEFGP